MAAVRELSGDDMAALVLNRVELSRAVASYLMKPQVPDLAGDRCSRDKPNDGRFCRWGANPSSTPLSGM